MYGFRHCRKRKREECWISSAQITGSAFAGRESALPPGFRTHVSKKLHEALFGSVQMPLLFQSFFLGAVRFEDTCCNGV